MKRNMTRKFAVILSLALVACLGVATGTAYAYYTDTSKANGMISFQWEPDEPYTDIEEELHGLDKSIVVNNIGGENAADALVRVKLVYPDPTKMEGQVTINVAAGEGWQQVGDWYYYMTPLAPGASTTPIDVNVEVGDKSKLRDFDIVVMHQCAKAEGTSLDDWHGTFAASEGTIYLKDPANPEVQSKQPTNPITAEGE